jgi:hypothetical protein
MEQRLGKERATRTLLTDGLAAEELGGQQSGPNGYAFFVAGINPQTTNSAIRAIAVMATKPAARPNFLTKDRKGIDDG